MDPDFLEDEEPPTFRPFTMDDLLFIEDIIFENRIAARKRAEKRAKNIKEFGEGARARKLYENDSDLEEEDTVILKPNNKLEVGNDLPRRYGEFPPELVGTPVCDIDPYYRDKLSFMVVSKGGSIFRFSSNKAFFLLSPFHPIRRVAIFVLTHWLFSFSIISTILANCYVMMQPDTEYTSSAEIAFTAIYTYEAVVKLTSRGLLVDKFTYLRDAWNWLDFLVIVMSYVTIIIDLGNFQSLRSFRVFRALKSVAVIPGLKTIVTAIIYSVKNLKDVIILTLFMLAAFALLGLQIYNGVLTQICILDLEEDESVNDTTWHRWASNSTNWYINPDTGKTIRCGNSSGAGACPLGTTCLSGFGDNPNYGYTSFDNFGSAYLCAFRLMTQDFWESLYQLTIRTAGPMSIFFFMFNILIGSFYLINLILAIVAMSYDELQRQAEEEARRELEESEKNFAKEEAALKVAEAEAREQQAATTQDAFRDLHRNGDEVNERLIISSQPLPGGGNTSETRDVNKSAPWSLKLEELPIEPFDPNSLRRSIVAADLTVLNNIIDSVSVAPVTLTSKMGKAMVGLKNDDEDDEERIKRLFVSWTNEAANVLCIWDCAWIWIRFSEFCAFVVFDAFTELFITLCIAVNVAFMSLDHYTLEYNGMSPFYNQLLTYGNYFFTAVFALESFVKLAAMSPKFFFQDKWNVFDFFIVVLSLVELLLDGIKGLSMLRSFRLLRVFKLAKSWKSLNDILTIMANTMGALSYLTFVLLIIIFIFAVMGMQLFGSDYQKNVCEKWQCVMPRWNFIDFFHSFMIVFRVLCGEWIESMWDCMYISGVACVPYFLATVLVANLVILNLFLALLLSSFTDMGSGKAKEDGEPDKMAVAIGRFVKLKGFLLKTIRSLFSRRRISASSRTAPIVLANGNGVAKDRPNEKLSGLMNGTVVATGNGVVDVHRSKNGAAAAPDGPLADPDPLRTQYEMKLKGSEGFLFPDKFDASFHAKIGHGMDIQIKEPALGDGTPFLEHGKSSGQRCLGGPGGPPRSGTADGDLMGGVVVLENGGEEDEEIYYYPEDEIVVQDCCPAIVYNLIPFCRGDEKSPFWVSWDYHRLLAYSLIENKHFETVVLALILVSSFVMTLEDIWFDTRPVLIDSLYYLDKILTVVFLLETLMKLFAMGFVSYFGNAWCWLDFIIVAMSLINLAAGLLGAGNIAIFKTMRTLRALRPLRAMSKMEGMKVVVNALVGALPSIFNVLLVCLIFWLIFAIIGVNLFMGKFYKCVDSENNERYSNEIIHNRTVCDWEKANGAHTEWVNSRVTFDSVKNAYLALMQVATWKGWIDVMNDAVDSADIGDQPHRENSIYSYLYFVFFIVFGSFFTLNLLVGVIIDKFNEQKNKGGSSLDAFMTEDQKKYISAMKKASTKKPLKALPRPYWKPQAIVFGIVTNKKFDMVIMGFIALNMLTMMCDHYGQTETWTFVLDNLNLFFVVVFTTEMVLKMFALRHHYFREPWNVFDFVVVVLSLLALFLSDLISAYFVSPTLLRVARVLKIGRVLRLIKGAKGIRTLLFSLVMAFPALINIFLLLVLIMIIYSVFGMTLFKSVKIRPGFDDVHNFQTFFKTFTLLFQICTSAGWSDAWMAISNEDDCEPANDQTGSSGDCGSAVAGVSYMISYLVLSFLIIVNMYIAVILENYSQATEDVQDGITDEDYDLFYEIWREFDPNGSQYMSSKHLSEFMDVLEPPLRIPAPNKFKIVQLDVPIVRHTNSETGEVRNDQVFCADILDLLTQDFFSRKGGLLDAAQKVEDIKVSSYKDRPGYERISSTNVKQRERFCVDLVLRAWKHANRRQQLPVPQGTAGTNRPSRNGHATPLGIEPIGPAPLI